MKKQKTKTLRATLLAVVATLITLAASPAQTFAQSEESGNTGYVSVNGLNYYYEIQGQGDLSTEASAQAEPLLLLHGGLGSFEMFNSILPMLTEDRKVIGVDLHGHGRTELGDRSISYTGMGDDIAAILKKLGYDKVDVLGYSMGSGVGFRFAVQHPEMVRRLVMVSGSFTRDGFYPGILQQQAQVGAEMAEAMKGTPMYQSYVKIAPNPKDFPKLLDQIGELVAKPYNWSEDVKTLTMPVMLIYGDSDMFRPEHIVDFYQLLGGGLKDAGWQRENMSQNRLAILPNLTHYEIIMAPELARTALPFLNGENGAPSWSEQVQETQN